MSLNTTLNTQDLLRQIKSGDKKALERAYLFYRETLVQWLQSKYNATEEEALDVYQDTMLVFYQKVLLGKLPNLQSSLKTYLYAIGRNILLEKRRKNKLETGELTDIHLNLQEDNGQLINNQIEQTEQKQMLMQVVGQLGEPCYTITTMFYVFDKPLKEIAQQLAYNNINVVYTQKNRCLKQLRTLAKKRYKKGDF